MYVPDPVSALYHTSQVVTLNDHNDNVEPTSPQGTSHSWLAQNTTNLSSQMAVSGEDTNALQVISYTTANNQSSKVVSSGVSKSTHQILFLPRLQIPTKSSIDLYNDFKCFPDLPREVRNRIYELVATEPRRILVYFMDEENEDLLFDERGLPVDYDTTFSPREQECMSRQPKCPGVPQVNKEARAEGFCYYTICSGEITMVQ